MKARSSLCGLTQRHTNDFMQVLWARTLTFLRPFSSLCREETMGTTTSHPYIVSEPKTLNGVPIVIGTRTPVRAIAELWKFGVAPEEIAIRLPHLTLAQVFDALSYYQDHRDNIDRDILRNRVPDDMIDPRLR